ncbi:Alpha/Beta hydrolase protein [Spinellus fusiger]|nr:Alpha/Beta hydrolase protein [Spinellus fusiger]
MEIKPFSIPSLTEKQTSDLRYHLQKAEFSTEFDTEVGWDYGAPRSAVEPLVKAWADNFNWEKSREEMNHWHHYHTEIKGLNIHFVHELSSKDNAIPILLLHGWPSTFYEFHKIIEPLRDGVHNGQNFHVIVPSLPGYGFSDAPKKTGYGVAEIGDTMNTLMIKLGYKKYMVFGTDWGSIIGQWIGAHRSENCKSLVMTIPLVYPPIPTFKNIVFRPTKVAKLLASSVMGFDAVYGTGAVKAIGRSFVDVLHDHDAGYRCIQATRPFTLGYGLYNSPVGLLAWLLEKYHAWTHHPSEPNNALPETISQDEFLTQLTIFWMTKSISSSIRLYYEFFQGNEQNTFINTRIDIPCGISYFEYEMSRFPQEWFTTTLNLKQYNVHEVGGHFASLEVGDLVIRDIQSFAKKVTPQQFA